MTSGDSALIGLGLRAIHYSHILKTLPCVGWFEAISENYFGLGTDLQGGRPLSFLEKIRQHYPIALHGVSLSLGSTDPIDPLYLRKLKALADRIEPCRISDHLCWTGVDGENLHDLLPLPYTEEALIHLLPRISEVQEFLGRPILLENVSSYLSYETSRMTEWEFLSELTSRSGCKLLLDINNIHVSASNHGYDPLAFISGIDQNSVAQFHLGGHSVLQDHLLDTHDHPVAEAVWDLFEVAIRRFGKIPTLIEWDDKIPSFETLENEGHRARETYERRT